MKKFTISHIRELNPCYDPSIYLPEDWEGTLVDILRVKDCPPKDRIWVVSGLLDDKTNRSFAIWCARRSLELIDNPDPRSIAACEVAEQYSIGRATDKELWDATINACNAAVNAAGYAAAHASRINASFAAFNVSTYSVIYVTAEAQIEHLINMLEER